MRKLKLIRASLFRRKNIPHSAWSWLVVTTIWNMIQTLPCTIDIVCYWHGRNHLSPGGMLVITDLYAEWLERRKKTGQPPPTLYTHNREIRFRGLIPPFRSAKTALSTLTDLGLGYPPPLLPSLLPHSPTTIR